VAVFGDFPEKTVHYFKANLFVGLLPAPKAESNPHLQIVTEELDGVIPLGCEIVGIDAGGQLYLLHPRSGTSRFLSLLGLFVLKLSEFDNPADGRRCVGNDFDQVHPLVCRQPKGIAQRHDSQLFLVGVDDANLSCANLAIAARLG